MVTRDQTGAVVGVGLADRFIRVATASRARRGADLAIRRLDHDRRTGSQGRSTRVHRRSARSRTRRVGWFGERERRVLLDWVGEHLPQVRRSVYEQRLLYWSLGIGLVVGLAAHVGGYLLKSPVTTEPFGLVADLLHALGWALWTGVLVVVFVQLVPEAKRRQYKQALDAYEAAQREQGQAGSDQAAASSTILEP